jgi:hypothetical protein
MKIIADRTGPPQGGQNIHIVKKQGKSKQKCTMKQWTTNKQIKKLPS